MKSKLSIDQINKFVALIRDPAIPKSEIFATVERGLKIKPGAKPRTEIFIPDPMQTGFGIRLLRSGPASWILRYSVRGKQKPRELIGDVLGMPRKTALEAAHRLLAKVRLDRLDPQEARRRDREANKRTWLVVVAEFLERKEEERLRPGTLTDYKNYLRDKYYFEPFHNRPFDEIDGREFKERIKFIQKEAAKKPNARGGNETAKACHAAVKYLYDWAAENDLFDENRRNPLFKVPAPVRNPPRDRVLTPEEIRIVWRACDDWEAETLDREEKGIRRAPGGFSLLTDYPRSVQLFFLTGMREDEMGDLHWDEVNLSKGEIFLDKHRVKEKRAKLIPLTGMAIEILRKIETDWRLRRPNDVCVFGRGDGRIIKRDGIPWKQGLYLGDTVRKIIKRLERGDTDFWKHVVPQETERRIWYALDSRKHSVNQIMRDEKVSHRTIKAIEAKYKDGPVKAKPAVIMDHWTLHDIRRTFRTGLAECGVSVSIAERIVGHLDPYSNKTEGTYNKYEYWKEKCDALNKWEVKLRSILDGTCQDVPRSSSSKAA